MKNFIEPQQKFLESCEFISEWGKAMKKDKWDDAMKQFELLKKIKNVKL